MARVKQNRRTRSKAHKSETLKLRKRKNRFNAKRRQARSRPHRRASSKKR